MSHYVASGCVQLHCAFIYITMYEQSLQAYVTIINYVEEPSLSFATTLRSNEPRLNLVIKNTIRILLRLRQKKSKSVKDFYLLCVKRFTTLTRRKLWCKIMVILVQHDRTDILVQPMYNLIYHASALLVALGQLLFFSFHFQLFELYLVALCKLYLIRAT